MKKSKKYGEKFCSRIHLDPAFAMGKNRRNWENNEFFIPALNAEILPATDVVWELDDKFH